MYRVLFFIGCVSLHFFSFAKQETCVIFNHGLGGYSKHADLYKKKGMFPGCTVKKIEYEHSLKTLGIEVL